MGQDTDDLREQIAATRERLGETVDALAQRATVENITERAGAVARGAVQRSVDGALVRIGERVPPPPRDGAATAAEQEEAARQRGLLLVAVSVGAIVLLLMIRSVLRRRRIREREHR